MTEDGATWPKVITVRSGLGRNAKRKRNISTVINSPRKVLVEAENGWCGQPQGGAQAKQSLDDRAGSGAIQITVRAQNKGFVLLLIHHSAFNNRAKNKDKSTRTRTYLSTIPTAMAPLPTFNSSGTRLQYPLSPVRVLSIPRHQKSQVTSTNHAGKSSESPDLA